MASAPPSASAAPIVVPRGIATVDRLATWARRRSWIVMASLVVVGAIVYLPCLRSNLLLDDYLHASMIDGTFPAHRNPFDLYDFVAENERATMLERGVLPWWSQDGLRIRFLRPLSSVLRWSEQRAFGRSPVLPHIHSFLWWCALVFAARRLFRRLLPERPAFVATLVFAFAPCHALPLGWLANREAIISLTFGTFALDSYLRWRDGEGARHAALACGLFCVSMAGGEYALCLAGYVIALEALDRRRKMCLRLGGLLLYFAPLAVYLALRAWLGYGTVGSGFYNDPLHEPMAFLRVAPRRLGSLLATEWLTLDGFFLMPTASAWALIGMVAGVVAIVSIPLYRAIAALPDETRRRVTAMFLGSQAALAPVLSVDPAPRVLGAAVLGLAPAVAVLLDHAWFPPSLPARRGLPEFTGFAALVVGFFQLVHGPATAWLVGDHYRTTSVDFAQAVEDLHGRVGDLKGVQLTVLRGFNSTFFMPFALEPDGRPPERWRVLATTGHVLGLRKGPRTLELVGQKNQSLFSWDLFRDMDAKMRVGQVFDTPGVRATILDVGPAGPRRIRFDLDRDLDAADITWVTEDVDGAFTSIKPPQMGFGQPYEP